MTETTPRPWTVHDYSNDRTGYIGIRGPNNEKIADIFPFAREGGVGIEVARKNAILITIWANERRNDQESAVITTTRLP